MPQWRQSTLSLARPRTTGSDGGSDSTTEGEEIRRGDESTFNEEDQQMAWRHAGTCARLRLDVAINRRSCCGRNVSSGGVPQGPDNWGRLNRDDGNAQRGRWGQQTSIPLVLRTLGIRTIKYPRSDSILTGEVNSDAIIWRDILSAAPLIRGENCGKNGEFPINLRV